MMTVNDALKLGLSEALTQELSKYPGHYVLCLSDEDVLYICPDTPENLAAFELQKSGSGFVFEPMTVEDYRAAEARNASQQN